MYWLKIFALCNIFTWIINCIIYLFNDDLIKAGSRLVLALVIAIIYKLLDLNKYNDITKEVVK